MVATSLLSTSYVNPSTAHTPSCPLPHRRPPNGRFFVPRLSPAAPAALLGGRWPLRERQGARRGECQLARAGPPSTSTLVFAFVFPLSLIIGTIFASIRIADQLDEKFLEELAMNKAIMEEREVEDRREDELLAEDEDARSGYVQAVPAAFEVTSATPRSRNRPKREA